jgi:hypothetical protein
MASLGLAYLDSSDSDCEIVPESPPGLPITESPSPALPSTELAVTLPLPPLDQQFETEEAGYTTLNNFARQYGYALVSTRSKRTKKGVKKTVRLRCDRYSAVPHEPNDSGHYPNDSVRYPNDSGQRRSITLSNECLFAISLRLQLDTQLWYITVENLSHNYSLSPISTHPIHRRNELV